MDGYKVIATFLNLSHYHWHLIRPITGFMLVPCFGMAFKRNLILFHFNAKRIQSKHEWSRYSELRIAKWMEAANKEIKSLEKTGTWKEVPITDAKTRILPGTWVFRRKRTPDGAISKYKARYCVRGDLQETIEETFAPVVAWSTVRLFLVLSLTLDWQTCTIDFSSAFVQAPTNWPSLDPLTSRISLWERSQHLSPTSQELIRTKCCPKTLKSTPVWCTTWRRVQNLC